MKYRICLILLCLICGKTTFSQTISGKLTLLPNRSIKLEGFNGFKTYLIANSAIDENGNFKLHYSESDYGIGYLISEGKKPFFVILGDEEIEIIGEALSNTESIKVPKSKENQLFGQYATEHPRREQALSAWQYLGELYKMDSLFSVQVVPKQAILTEKERIKKEDSLFLAHLPSRSYVSWYLPIRKLVSSVSTIAQYRTEEIPAAMASFRRMDYTERRLYKSGLLKDAIDSHFWLIENSGRSLDSVYIEMNISIDYMLENLSTDEEKFNEITAYLFKLLEQRSLFKASEYLALKVLNEDLCALDDDLSFKMESYRAMKKGNIVPDFAFPNDFYALGYKDSITPKKLSDVRSDFKVLVFGASWCPKCPEDLMQISQLYDKWKKHDVEVVFVSLDEDKEVFENFSGAFPFISMSDYQKWESPIVKSFHVFATPTLYLINEKLEILLRPNSVSQLDSWIDWYLIEGNN